MSEEILKALMQLFAILTKQDGGVEDVEKQYVKNFLFREMGESHSDEYYFLFEQISSGRDKEESEKDVNSTPKLTSVLDSVRILGICKKINKTLNQSQKVVVLVRLFELISVSGKFATQRKAIIDTISEVFRIPNEEHKTIEKFVLSPNVPQSDNQLILSASDSDNTSGARHILTGKLDGQIFFLRVPDVNLYFLKYTGEEDVYLNGLSIKKDRIYLFSRGSTIKVPKGKPLYYSDVAASFLTGPATHSISLAVKGLNYLFRSGSRGLNNISFTARQGNLFGILGASGAGKTTLLNVLSGISRPSSGSIRINGMDIYEDYEELRGVTGYVPQDDLLIEELTVFENLYYNARLCFGNLDREAITEKVNHILFSLGLEDKKDLKVGNPFNKTISGGQRKRLNIALELIREPSLLFIDEPTSGLSSRDSENVMDLLRELTLKGKLIFAVIHQPSSEIFKMFDNVIILDTGGRMVYSGNPVEAVMYFKRLDAQINSDVGECPTCGSVNPELIFNILEARVVDEYGNYTSTRKVSSKKWEEYFKKEAVPEEIPESTNRPPKTLNLPGWLRQFRIFTVRDFLAKISNRQYLIITLLQAPLLAFILSYIIRYIVDPASDRYIFRENENIPIYIFMSLIVALFLGLTLSAEEIFRDRKIRRREKFLNLSTSGYLASKITILLVISAIQALSFVLVANSIIELRGMNYYYWFAFFSTAACANMIGLNISASFNSAVTIYIVIPLVMIPMMILSGAMFSFDKLNRNISRIDKVPLLAEIMPSKWSYEALMVKQFRDNMFQKNFYELDKRIINSDFQLSFYIPELEERLDRCRQDFRENGKLTDTRSDYRLIINELRKESEINSISFPLNEKETGEGSFNPDIVAKISDYLNDLKLIYRETFIRADREKTFLIDRLLNERRDLYFTLLNMYHNESVSDHVRKIWEKNKLLVYRENLVRMADPIYLDPYPGSFIGIRSHFFAPRKYFMGRYYDTYNFNMGVIWVLTGVLYGWLYVRLGGKG